MRLALPIVLSALAVSPVAHTASVDVPLNLVDEKGAVSSIGNITIGESAHGLVFTPNLAGLPSGIHGFHIHDKPSCDPAEKDGKPVAALGAGGHWDPEKTGRHEGPFGSGHLGDLPALYVAADGKATYPVLAPRLKSLDEVRGHALMVHAGADNHSDHPAALGGGGARMACGVIR